MLLIQSRKLTNALTLQVIGSRLSVMASDRLDKHQVSGFENKEIATCNWFTSWSSVSSLCILSQMFRMSLTSLYPASPLDVIVITLLIKMALTRCLERKSSTASISALAAEQHANRGVTGHD